MRGSLKIAKLFGVPVFLHWSFALVPIAVFFIWQDEGTESKGLLWLSLFATCLFISILLHEYGHVLAARRFGVSTKDIILLPIGGLARLTRLPERPLHELIVAIAGPLVNVAIAILLFPFVYVFWKNLEINALPIPEPITEDFNFFIPMLFGLNILLAVFNLIPAFPMDGGRILRALLSMKFTRLRATWVAARLGQIVAIGMVIFAIVEARPSYTLIGAFIYFTARKEYGWVKTESVLAKYTVEEAYRKAAYCSPASQPYFGSPAKIDHVIFLADETKNIVAWIPKYDNEMGKVSDEMARPLGRSVSALVNLKEANQKMQSNSISWLTVTEGETPIGILENWMIWEHLDKMEREKK